ncbi:MAG: SDR family NAD(P)-dependent oxidoreductase [Candidatus Eremiobacteraeota bacterium]|nr:SDR family NAD(P)-dependent oxidoreductase [Candidatus Eremiobacteraeota bacterium]
MQLSGKVAVVTGAGGGGSGRAIARRIARAGGLVVVSDVNDEGGAQTVALIAQEGGTAIYRRADVQKEEDVRELVAAAQKSFGPVSVMVNNASGPEYRPDLPLESWDAIVQTELLGTMYGIRAAREAMRARGGGAIVNISSTSALEHGRSRPGGSPAYDAGKATVLRRTTMLGFLGDTEGIRVNCVVPHWVASPGPKEYYDSLTPEQREERGVPAVLITLDAMADAVVRLATDETLSGRALILWGGRKPALIQFGDRGYAALEALP